MTNNNASTFAGGKPQPALVIERNYQADIRDVWELWTTPEGIESWWGPEGFSVKVLSLDLRPGGKLIYAMTATGPEQVEFMKQAGMPLTTEAQVTYEQVVPRQRIVYSTLVDFVADVRPYDVTTVVEFSVAGGNVKMVLTSDPMHNAEWTQNAALGHESQLNKIEVVLRQKGARP